MNLALAWMDWMQSCRGRNHQEQFSKRGCQEVALLVAKHTSILGGSGKIALCTNKSEGVKNLYGQEGEYRQIVEELFLSDSKSKLLHQNKEGVNAR